MSISKALALASDDPFVTHTCQSFLELRACGEEEEERKEE
jgi:hypothetical protein